MSHKEQIIIGIDPDVDRNGIAMLDMSTHSLQVQMLTFPNLLDFIKEKYRQFAEIDKWDFKVIIEAGWMNRGNYHIQRWQGIASLGVDQGRNEQVSRTIGQMMEHWGHPLRVQETATKVLARQRPQDHQRGAGGNNFTEAGQAQPGGTRCRPARLGLRWAANAHHERNPPRAAFTEKPHFFTEIGTNCVNFLPKVITL